MYSVIKSGYQWRGEGLTKGNVLGLGDELEKLQWDVNDKVKENV